MRVTLLSFILFLPIIGTLTTLFLGSRLRTFARSLRFIETRRQLEHFKAIAAVAMYGSIVQLLLLFAPIVFYLVGIVGGDFLLEDVLFVVIPTGIYLFIYVRYKRLEARVQETRMDNQELLPEFIRVVDTWKKKALPDWNSRR